MLPVLFHWGETIVYSYPLFIGLAWGVGYRLSETRLPRDLSLTSFKLWMLGVFVSSWLGAKLLFLLTQSQYDTSELIGASNFWLGGGFVFLGGFIGSTFFAFSVGLLLPRFKLNKMQFTLIPLLWSHAIGRVGCFLAGCCYGTHTELPWAIPLHADHRHPVQLYEVAALSLLALGLGKFKTDIQLTAYLIGYGFVRWTLEWLRGDDLRGIWLGQSSSQWVSGAMVLLGFVLLARANTLKKLFL